MANSNEITIDTTGVDEVYHSVSNDSDKKRFGTLNLTVTMKLCPDGKSNLKPHIVFKASKFQPADEWHDREEHQQWDPRVVISFQTDAWVDAETHRYALTEAVGPMDKHLEDEKMRGVTL